MAQKSRHFRFTAFNHESKTKQDELGEAFKADGCRYYCWGEEECPKTKRHHLQGHISYTNPRAFNLKTLIKKFGEDIRWFISDYPIKSINYTKKDGKWVEWGDPPKGQGKRTDISSVKEMIADGKGMKDIVEVATSYQSLRMAEILLKYKEKKRDWKPKVMWFYGDTGCGKTKMALELCPDAYISGKNLKWWEGYDAHEHVIIDDFRRDFCTFHELLRILDRYEYRIEVKGSSRQLLARVIIITCPFHPMDLWDGRSVEDSNQLMRRIDEIWRFTKEGCSLIVDGTPERNRGGGGNSDTPPPTNNNVCDADRDMTKDILYLMNK